MGKHIKICGYIPIQVRVDSKVKIDFKAILKGLKEANTYEGLITKELIIIALNTEFTNIFDVLYKDKVNPTMGFIAFRNQAKRLFIEWLLNL